MTLTSVARKWGISRSLVCKLVNRSRGGEEGSVPPPATLVDSTRVMQSSSEEVAVSQSSLPPILARAENTLIRTTQITICRCTRIYTFRCAE
jgi:hypothetical protein